MKKDKHHLVPKHRGGKNADGLVEVTKTQHAMFHFCEWQLHKNKYDYIAWKTISGQIEGEAARRLAAAEYCKNKVWTEESKEKIREYNRNNKGRKNTPEAKANQSKAARNRTTGNAVRRDIICSNGKVYETTRDAERDTGVGRGTINKLCLGQQKRSYKSDLSFCYKT